METMMLTEVDFTKIETMTVLGVWSMARTAGLAATVPQKGATDYAVEWLVQAIAYFGDDEIIVQRDQEPSIVALVDLVIPKLQKENFKVKKRDSPVRSSQSQGGIERYFRRLEEETRALRLEVERRTEMTLSTTMAFSHWLVRAASLNLLRFHVNPELNTTPFMRIWAHPYQGKIVFLGETVLVRQALTRDRGGVVGWNKFDTRWLEGMWLGKSIVSEEHLVALSSTRLGKFRTIRRLPDEH